MEGHINNVTKILKTMNGKKHDPNNEINCLLHNRQKVRYFSVDLM